MYNFIQTEILVAKSYKIDTQNLYAEKTILVKKKVYYIFVCVCVKACTGRSMHVDVGGQPKGSIFIFQLLETMHLLLSAMLCTLVQVDQEVLEDFPYLDIYLSMGVLGFQIFPQSSFYMGLRDPNSYLQTCRTNSLTY